MMKSQITLPAQRGAVLIVGLIMLLLLTMLGISGMRSTTMEERMAGNMRNQNTALQAAEAALREAEAWIAPKSLKPSTCLALATGCEVFAAGVLPSLNTQTITWWNTYGQTYSQTLNAVPTAPRFVREELAFLPDNLDLNRPSTGRVLYRVTARGTGQTGDAVVIIQTTFAKRYN